MKQKFLLFLFIACTFALSTQAQINKGALWLGGGISYGSTENKSEPPSPTATFKTLVAAPAVGIAVKNNFVIGVSMLYTNGIHEDGYNPIKTKEAQVGGGVFVRKYFPIIKQLYIFGEAAASYSNLSGKAKAVSDGSELSKSKGHNVGLNITPGVSFAVTNSFHLEAGFRSLLSASYLERETTFPNSPFKRTTKQFGGGINADNGSQLFIGFRFILNKKA